MQELPTAGCPGHLMAGPRVSRPNRSPSRSPGGHLRPLSACPPAAPASASPQQQREEQGRESLGRAPLSWSCSGSSLPAFFSPPSLLWLSPSSSFRHHWFLHAETGPESWVAHIQLHAWYPERRSRPGGPGGLCAFAQAVPSTWHLSPSPTCNILHSSQDKVGVSTLQCCPFSKNEATPWP